MATQEENKLLKENIRLKKEEIVQAEKKAASLKKGTAEYRAQQKELKSLKSDLVFMAKNEDRALKLKQRLTRLDSDRQDKTKQINKEYLSLNKREAKSIDLYKEVTSLAQGINGKLRFAKSLQEGISVGGRDLVKEYGASEGKLNAMGTMLEDVLGNQDESAQLALDMAKNYEKIGTSDFKDMSQEIAKLEQEALERRNEINNKISAGNYPADLVKSLKEELRVLEDATAALKAKNTQYSMTNSIANEASGILTAPFDKMKSLMESLPFGGLASKIVGLDDIQTKFTDGIAKSTSHLVKQFMETGKVNMLMVKNIKGQMTKAIDGLNAGFSKLNGLTGGMLGPILLVVGALMLAKKAMEMFFGGTMETRKELGVTTLEAAKLQNITNTAAMQFKFLGVSAEDISSITKGIQENMGGVSQVTQETVTGMASLNANFGIAGEDAAKLMTTMQAVGSASQGAAMSQLESVGHLARQNGVAPSAIISDMASDMDTFASFAQDGGKNLATAAISARKLGIDMATTAKMAESLLSFEDSINAQMEASMLTGRMINTDKARELALAGDLDGMQREITSQIGSAAEFESMNVIQRQKLAAAFGVSVGELSKMVTNQDKLNNMTDSEKKKRDLIAGAMEELGKAGTQLLSALKSMIPLLLGILSPFILIGGAIATVLIGVGKVLELLNKLNVAGIGLGDVLMGAAGAALIFRSNLLGGGIMNGITKMKDMVFGMVGKMKGLGGAASGATKAVSGGASTAASAVKGGGIGETIAKGGKGMGAGLKGLSKGVGAVANPKVLLGLAALTLAVIGIGYALKLAAPGIKAFGEAMGTIIKSIATGIATVIGSIGDFAVKLMSIASPTLALGLFATAAGFTALAGSMAIFATAGLLAMPALLALTAFNAVTGAGGGGESENTMEIELKKQNEKLDRVITLLSEDGPIAMNTEKGAKAGEGFIKSVIMA